MRYDTSLHFFEMVKLTNNQTTSYFGWFFFILPVLTLEHSFSPYTAVEHAST